MSDSLKSYLTPPEIAKLLRVSSEKVLGWIRKAELTAINVGDGNRPRYRIRREDLDSFLRSREVQPPAPRTRRNHRRYGNTAVVQADRRLSPGGVFRIEPARSAADPGS